MKKIIIEGINGSIEVTNKYVIVTIGTKEKKLLKEHIVLFEEIENIEYKKPTKDKYGYFSLYLSRVNFLTKEKINYTLILDKIDEKSLENNKKIYNVIKDIVDNNKNIKIIEVKKKNNEEEKEPEKVKENEIENDTIIELPKKEKNEEKDNEIITQKSDIKELENGNVLINEYIKENEINNTLVKDDNNKIIDFKNIEYNQNNTDYDIEKINNNQELLETKNDDKEIKTYLDFEDELDDIEEIEEIENLDIYNTLDNIEEQNSKIIEFEELENKLYNLEKDLLKLSYKEMILNKYVDRAKEKDEIDRLIIEIKKIIEELSKIKKEIIKGEKIVNQNDFIKLDNGNVIITSISDRLDINLTSTNNLINKYQEITKEIEEHEKEIDALNNNSELKKDEIKLKDEEYEREINILNNVKSQKELIEKYREECAEKLNRVRKEIKTTIEPRKKFKFVKKGIRDITKKMAILTTINELRPNHSRFSKYAFALSTGLLAINDILGYDMKEVKYNEIVTKEMLVGFDNIDTKGTRLLLENSKDEIEKIINECKLRYKDYPKFDELYRSLNDMKNDLEKESEELKKVEDKLYYYKSQDKVKILRKKQE